MTDIRIVKEYNHPAEKVWRALTEPPLIARWLMRPEGFAPKVGTRFRLVAKPQPGWRGYVDCEVIDAVANKTLAYRWSGDDKGVATIVRYSLEPTSGGTRLVFEHAGFAGFGGFILAKMMMGPGWRKMFLNTMPRILAALRDDGTLNADADLPPKFGEPALV
jgi:uncharacterized protein YndB with AHSA1/START domain